MEDVGGTELGPTEGRGTFQVPSIAGEGTSARYPSLAAAETRSYSYTIFLS